MRDVNDCAAGLSAGRRRGKRRTARGGIGGTAGYQAEALEPRVLLAGRVVINEISYDPDVKTEPVEFIELTNPGDMAVDLSGATFTKGITYTFPAGTTLAPGAFVVVSEDPAALQTKFGASSFGPWVGSLRNSGEQIQLEDPVGNVLDDVTYGAGFPWPTIGDAPGYSIELINPNLDNDLGGNWRSFDPSKPQQVTLIDSGSTWTYRKGTSEASSPSSYWRELDYTPGSGWSTGAAPIGYDTSGTPVMHTMLTDMNGTYTSVFMRKLFEIADPSEVLGLTLQAQYDDGFNVWINGKLAQSVNVPSGNAAVTATASSDRENNSFQNFSLNPTFLQPGNNVIAVQFFNFAKTGSPDAFFDGRLIETTGTGGPTPGQQNATFAANAPPSMRQVSNSPQMPAANQPVTITAKVTDPDGVASVNLSYQVVDAGNYIAREDAAYTDPANWTTVPMHDDGLNGDATAGDGIYSVVMPASLQVNRRLVRYRITSSDMLGATITGPYADDPVPNFAYYVYNGVPTYSAALQPGAAGAAGQVVNYPASALGVVPMLQLITKQIDHDNSQHIPGATTASYSGSDFVWSGTLVSNGVVYDDIHYRARGGVWRYAMGKNVWKIDFQNDHLFQVYYPDGTPYATKWKKLNLRADIQQGDIGDRGEQGLFETLGYQMFRLAGVPAEATIPMTLRIVESASDTGTSQYNTDFQGLYLAVEEQDGHFLDAHNLPDGNIYKMESGTGAGGGALHNQGPTQPTDNSDLVAFANTLASNPSDQWIRDNVDLPEFYSFQAVTEMIHNWDIGFGKNYDYYHNPVTNKWEIIPWDLDLTFYVTYEPGGGDLVPMTNAILSRPAFQMEYRNRVRELRDLLFNGEQIGKMADAYANLVNPPGVGPTLVGADAAMWDYNPIETSSFVNSSKAGVGGFYQKGLPTQDFPGMVARLKTWSMQRLSYMDSNVLTSGDEAAAPRRPTVTYTGPGNYPSNALTFSSSAFAPGNAGGSFTAMQWRLADVTPVAPGQDPTYEVNDVWDSGVLGSFNPSITLDPAVIVAGHTYRLRVRMQDTNGRWSHWSDAVVSGGQFTATPPNSAVRESLRLTELNYDPAKPPAGSLYNNDDFEFVELKNFGSQPIDLNGVRFTNGITYTFGDVTLQPGQAGVLVKNVAAFTSRYGTGPLVLGEYAASGTSFNNAGEHVTLVDPFNQTIADFTYDGAWYAITKGGGSALEVIDPVVSPDLSVAANWRAGTTTDGTPGVENSITLSGVPGAATATAVSTTQINLQWVDGVSAEAGYRIFRRASVDAPFVQVADLAAGSTSDSDNDGGVGLTPGTTYEYRIQAYAAGGAGFSGYASASATTAAEAPIGLSAAAGNGAVTLVWAAVGRAAGYNVYRGTSPGGEGATPIATGLVAPGYIDTATVAGQTYYYQVTAVNVGGAEGARSNEVGAAIGLPGTIIGTAGSWSNQGNTKEKAMDGDPNTFFDAPDPGNGDWVGLDLGTPKVITQVVYAPRPGFASRMVYGVFQGANAADFSDAVTLYTITSAPSSGYTTRAISNPTLFRYVRYLAPDAAYGNIAELQFFGHNPVPAAPTGPGAVAGSRQVTLTWSAPAGTVGSYNIYRGTSAGNEVAVPIATGVTATSYTDGGLAAGQTYYYKVTAVNDGGEGPRSAETSATAQAPAVVGRWLFYNHSGFDGNDPLAGPTSDGVPSDDPAIDATKAALLPGQTATAANYSGYDKGINGVMIDVAGLVNDAGITAGDFSLAVGTGGSWASAPAPAEVAVRQGDGVTGSDRITIIWPDGAIANQWMRVTVKADANTGLVTPDVFYFGNLVGDTGDAGAGAQHAAVVSAVDLAAIRVASFAPVTASTGADVNKDGIVDASDTTIVRGNNTHALALISAPAAQVAVASVAAVPMASITPAGVAPTPTAAVVPVTSGVVNPGASPRVQSPLVLKAEETTPTAPKKGPQRHGARPSIVPFVFAMKSAGTDARRSTGAWLGDGKSPFAT